MNALENLKHSRAGRVRRPNYGLEVWTVEIHPGKPKSLWQGSGLTIGDSDNARAKPDVPTFWSLGLANIESKTGIAIPRGSLEFGKFSSGPGFPLERLFGEDKNNIELRSVGWFFCGHPVEVGNGILRPTELFDDNDVLRVTFLATPAENQNSYR